MKPREHDFEHSGSLRAMNARVAIGYLIPEFPAQTHNFFWNERNELFKLGIDTCLISTRRPAKALVSHCLGRHSFSRILSRDLAEIGTKDAIGILLEWIKLGPRAWLRALVASTEGCPPKLMLVRNLALMIVATRLVVLVRRLGLAHVHVHSCGNAALIATIANQLAGISYSLTLHGDLWDYGAQQTAKFRYAAFAITITRKLLAQIRETLKQDTPAMIGLAPMGVDVNVFQRPSPYQHWDQNGPLRLFSCGRLNFVKGHQDLIRAVRLLTDEGVDVVLGIAGEDDAGGGGYRLSPRTLLWKKLGTCRSGFPFWEQYSEERVLRGLRAQSFSSCLRRITNHLAWRSWKR